MSTSTQFPGAVSARFARFAAALSPRQIPTAVMRQARLCVLDSLGIALAARGYEFGRRAVAGARLLGGYGDAVVFGEPQGLPLRDAVLANGTLIHSLDFDDTHAASVVHCSASAWPVAFNVGHACAVSGADALTAYVLAVEIDARIGEVACGGLQARGFHPTGIVGAFGAAAAAAWLRKLDHDQHAHALGIVLSFAAGNMEFLSDGAWTKRLHPGWAGVCGITAAAFAESGYIGPGAPLEGRFGLFNTLLGPDRWQLGALGEDLGADWRLLGVALKPYPACHFNHAFADCALALRRDHGLEPADIASITALVHPSQVPIVCEPLAAKQRPHSAYEAQFSVPWIVAAALARGQFTLAEIAGDALADPTLHGLAARVRHAEDPRSRYPQYYSGGLTVRTHDGRELEHHIAVNRGADANPMSENDILDKYNRNAAPAVGAKHAERIADIVLCLDTAPNLDELAQALACTTAPAAAGRA